MTTPPVSGYCPRHNTVNDACPECDDETLKSMTQRALSAERQVRLAYECGYHAGRKARAATAAGAKRVARLTAELDALRRERFEAYQRGYAAGRAKGPRPSPRGTGTEAP